MSRIGKKPVTLPNGVSVKIDGQAVSVKGPKGELARNFHDAVNIVNGESNELVVALKKETNENKKFHGLSRTLLNNMVNGVNTGFNKSLKLIGVGYRAAVQGSNLNLTLGYSHPVIYTIPKGISIKVEKQTTVIVEGADKEQVGQVAADIRAFRKPEPYHGKGVRYSDEHIITKVGKAGGKK